MVLALANVRTGGLWFDGSPNNYVEIPHNDVLIRRLGDEITLSAWVFTPSYRHPFLTIAAKGRTATISRANYVLRYYYSRPNLYVEFYYRNSADTAWSIWQSVANVVTPGEWYHVAVAYKFGDGASIKCYVNGSPVSGSWIAGTGGEAPYLSTEPLWIGRISLATGIPTGEPFYGTIDMLSVHRKILTQPEVNKMLKGDIVRDGLVLLLDFTEYEGSTAYDKSGYNNHGTIYGARWVVKKALR